MKRFHPDSISSVSYRILNWTIRGAILATAGWQVRLRWDGWLSDDTISYLELARLLREGHATAAISAYWSPVYPALLAALLWILPDSQEQALLALRILSGLLFATQWLAFEYFVRGVEKEWGPRSPELRWMSSTLFLWSLWRWLPVQVPTPDPLVAIVVFLTAGLLVRERITPRHGDSGSALWSALLGAGFGVGYLCKTILLPVGWVSLLFVAFRHRKAAAWAFATFALIAAPWIIAISLQEGRLTWGDSGRLTYLWDVSACRAQLPRFRNWTGNECRAAGLPAHPVKLLLEHPRIYAMEHTTSKTSLNESTFPTWFDPSYFWKGARIPFSFRDQIDVLFGNLKYAWIRCLAFVFAWVSFGWLALPGFWKAWRRRTFPPVAGPLQAMIGAAFLAYGLGVNLDIAFAATRYLAPFWLVAGVLLAWRWSASARSLKDSRTFRARGCACLIGAAIWAAWAGRDWRADPGLDIPSLDAAPEALIGARLERENVGPGDGIAVFETDSIYPRLAAFLRHWRIRATLDNSDLLGDASRSDEMPAVDRVLRNNGVKALVGFLGDGPVPKDWIRIEGTSFGFKRIAGLPGMSTPH